MKFSHQFSALLLLMAVTTLVATAQDEISIVDKGYLHFKSNAPLEIIEARSNALRGVLNTETRGFAFSLKVNSFDGFNSPLQREHFLENYMEAANYPTATFVGKIIEKINFDQDGISTIRAKGMLEIHGISKERIIDVVIQNDQDTISVQSSFTVPLMDHDIAIPKIVRQKIANKIYISLMMDMRKA